MDKTTLLDRIGALGEERMLFAKVLDRAEQTRNRNIPTSTDFLSPQQQVMAKDLLRLAGYGEEGYRLLGGYEEAERRILLFLPDWMEEAEETPIRCLRAAFRGEYHLTHRDILGSLMGMGIVREKTGDILVGPDSADLIVLDTVEPFLLQSWDSAGRAKLTVTAIDPAHLHIPVKQCVEKRDTVSSLRLDAIVASGFQMARGKAAELITSGRVQVNWRECNKPDKQLAQGDTVSARGFGKLEVAEIGGQTRKGRISVTWKRYT